MGKSVFDILKDRWANVEVPESIRGDFKHAPEGKHIAIINDALAVEGRDEKSPYIKWVLYFPALAFEEPFFDSLNDTDGSVAFIKRRVKDLGFPPIVEPDEMENILDMVKGWKVEVFIKKKDKYTNMYFNKVLEKTSLPKRTAEPEESKPDTKKLF